MGKITDFQFFTYGTTSLKPKKAVVDIPEMAKEVGAICRDLASIAETFKCLTTQDMTSSDFYDECNQVIEMCRNTSDALNFHTILLLNSTLERIKLVTQYNRAFASDLTECESALNDALASLGVIEPITTALISINGTGSDFAGVDNVALTSVPQISTYDGTVNGKDISSVVSTGGVENNCFTYAWRQYNNIWGTNVTSRDDYRSDIVANGVTVTAENLRTYLSTAPAGAMLRVDQSYDLGAGDISGHSLIYLGENADGTGARFAEGNIQGSSTILERSYVELASWCSTKKYKYIKYIAYPGANG